MTIKLKGSTDGSVSLSAPADTSPTGTDITLTLPTDAGSANQFIKNSGTAGTLDYSSMVEDSSGKVGINETAPAANLVVKQSGSTFTAQSQTVALFQRSSTTGHSAKIAIVGGNAATSDINFGDTDDEDAGLIQYAHTDNSFRFTTNASEAVRIDSSGNVGIGATSASAKLHVSAAYNETGLKVLAGAAGYSPSLVVGNSGGSEYLRVDDDGRLLVNTTTSRIVEDHAGNGPQGKIQIEATNSDAIMSIISAGTSDANRCGTLSLGRHRNSTIGGTPTVVQNNDALGAICFAGGDGTDMRTKGAKIVCEVDGTPGSNDVPARLLFSTRSDGGSLSERMRITSDGMVRMRGTTTSGALNVYSSQSASTSANLILGQHSASSITSGTLSFLVYTNGNVVNSNNSYGSLSDVNLKENIVDANSQWADIKGVRVRNYNFKEETGNETFKQLGVVAQEVEEVSPGLVNTNEDGIKSVNYSVLYMKAVKALQEAMTRIETLETKVAALEAA